VRWPHSIRPCRAAAEPQCLACRSPLQTATCALLRRPHGTVLRHCSGTEQGEMLNAQFANSEVATRTFEMCVRPFPLGPFPLGPFPLGPTRLGVQPLGCLRITRSDRACFAPSHFAGRSLVASALLRDLTSIISTLTSIISTLTSIISTLTSIISTLTSIISTFTSKISYSDHQYPHFDYQYPYFDHQYPYFDYQYHYFDYQYSYFEDPLLRSSVPSLRRSPGARWWPPRGLRDGSMRCGAAAPSGSAN
jgi:hypothetical protein